MNKTILATSIALSLGVVAPSAQAVFTPLGAGDYVMDITGGCFEFGNCQVTGNGAFTDNTAGQAVLTLTAGMLTGTRAVGDTIGSGSVGGDNGTIEFSLDGAGNMTITSYAQDSYLVTAGGTFYVDAAGANGTSNMTGTISATGDVFFTPTGREGGAGGFMTGIGVQPWNDSKRLTPPGYDSFSTGTQTNFAKGTSPAFSVTGSILQDDGSGGWTGVIAATGNINGDNWSGFNNVQYSEVFNISITSAGAPPIPIPAAAWLFGSGLLGLVGVARRRKRS